MTKKKKLEKWLSQFLTFFGGISLLGGILMIIWSIIKLFTSLFVPLEEFPLYNLFLLIGLLALFGFVIYSFYIDLKGGTKYWEEYAKLNGLKVIKNKVGRKIAILGRIDDRLVYLSNKTLPSIHDSEKEHTHTNLYVKLKTSSSITLSLIKEDTTIKFHKRMKTYQDIEIGHQQFDQKFLIQCSNEQSIKQLLTSDIQRELQIIHPQFSGELYISKEQVGYKDAVSMHTEKRLTHFHTLLPILLQIATFVETLEEDRK